MGKSAPTIGYWYKLAIHFGLCKGPIDALLEIRGGDRIAWSGEQSSSGTITINKPKLWGGEKSEGGLVSDLDVLLGEAGQAPNSYLASVFGGVQSAFRGLTTVVFKGGKYGAINPYPKPLAFKVRRILQGWDNDTCWYPEKAPINILGELNAYHHELDLAASVNAGLSSSVGITVSGLDPGKEYLVTLRSDGSYTAWNPFVDDAGGHANAWNCTLTVTSAGGTTTHFAQPGAADAGTALALAQAAGGFTLTGYDSYTFWIYDTPVWDNRGGVSLAIDEVTNTELIGMNPAHILYDTITSLDGQGDPIGMVNDASFRAAADTLYAERFGLCMTLSGEETIEAFQQRVCDIIGAALTQSRVNGEYYLDLIRGDYVLEDLPILSEADVIEFSQEPAVLTEAVNQVLVEWFDVQTRQDRTTTPAQSLGLIDSNGVISQTRTYRPIPYEALANRVAARDLRALCTPLSRFSLVTNRSPYALRPGQAFRLQMPSEGIEDLVCRLGSIDHGTLTDGRIRIVAVQDVFTLPSTVSVVDVPGDATAPGSTAPAAAAAERVLEAPYIELVDTLAAVDLAALAPDAGYLLTLGVRPDAGTINYSIYSAADGEGYVDRGSADWCPSALVVESATADPAEDAFTLSGGVDLDQLEIGLAAMWGDEIVRVDAIDVGTGAVTLARGCADTVPNEHAAGERIWFYDAYSGSDAREYVDGELVHAKLLTRTGSAELDLAAAAELSVTMAARAARPYAPGQFQVNGHALPTSETGTLAVTWAHRDRLLTADQLLESAAAGVGPEPGTQYVVTLKNNVGAVLHESDPISDNNYSFSYNYTGTATLELKAIRGALESWHVHSRTFSYTGATTTIPPVTPGPSEDLEPLDGSELVAITQDDIVKECTTGDIAQLAIDQCVAKAGDTMTGPLQLDLGAIAGGLEISADAGVVADLRLQAGGVERWVVRRNGDTEAGSDAGSNLEVISRTDAGVTKEVVLTFNRATGVADFTHAPTVGGSPLGAPADVMVFKGAINASSNPNYPAANAGDVYRISVAGKIGGASGPNVEAGDTLTAVVDGSSAGTHASVGANWVITQGNIDGAVIGPASVTGDHFAQFDGGSGKLIKGGISLDTDTALTANSDTRVPSQKAVKAAIAAAGGGGSSDNRDFWLFG